MVHVAVIGTNRGIIELLQRRIGGILKDIAIVHIGYYDRVDKIDAQVYFCYSGGIRQKQLTERFKNTNKVVIGVELALLPVGVRTINGLPKKSRITVLAEHLACANLFLSEIICSGVRDYRFSARPLTELEPDDSDYYLLPEDLADQLPPGFGGRKVILIPRTITPSCAAQIINRVMELT